MKQFNVLLLAVGAAIALSSCKSSQDAYRAAYENATTENASSSSDVVDLDQKPVMTVPSAKPTTKGTLKKEKVTVVEDDDISSLKKYSVVIGSFIGRSNAIGLRNNMIAMGYNAFLAKNEMGAFRVIVSSYDTREGADEARDTLKMKYAPDRFQDAWILESVD